jgi:hypothetical protein
MYLTTLSRTQTLHITSAFRDRKLQHQASRPRPLVAIPGARELTLVKGHGVKPAPDSPDYTTTAVYDYGTKTAFNGDDNVKTRLVRCSAVKLTLDETGPLAGYLGGKARDIEKLEIIADHVIVRSHAWFPGTDVAITARVLEFADRAGAPERGASRIDTTPIARDKAAVSAEMKGGYPVGPDGEPR